MTYFKEEGFSHGFVIALYDSPGQRSDLSCYYSLLHDPALKFFKALRDLAAGYFSPAVNPSVLIKLKGPSRYLLQITENVTALFLRLTSYSVQLNVCLTFGFETQQRTSEGSRTYSPVTHIVAVVSDAPPGSFPQHQEVHLRLHWTRAAQRLPAPIGGLPWVGVPDGQVQERRKTLKILYWFSDVLNRLLSIWEQAKPAREPM